MKKSYDLIIPFGKTCHAAMLLNKLNLRKCSYPMDWLRTPVGKEVMETRVNFLLNGFKGFLDKEDLSVFGEDKISGNLFVENKSSGLLFFHDFSIEKGLDKGYKRVRNKYNRRIFRLKRHLKISKNILLVYLQYSWNQKEETEPLLDEFLLKMLSARLNKKFKNKTIDFVIFEHDVNAKEGEYSQNEVSPNITIYRSNHDFTESDENNEGIILSVKKVFEDNYFIQTKLKTKFF